MQNQEYFDTVMCNLVDLHEGEKELLIVSSGKSTLAYETAVMIAERQGHFAVLEVMRCEDGKLHEHAFISRTYSTARRAVYLIEDCKAGKISRPMLQYNLGKLLGYTLREILDFIASKLARECPCDCCGGPFERAGTTGVQPEQQALREAWQPQRVAVSDHDESIMRARRTQFHYA